MLLGVSPRQIRRLRVRFRQQGFEAVIHGNTGSSPANRTNRTTLGGDSSPPSWLGELVEAVGLDFGRHRRGQGASGPP